MKRKIIRSFLLTEDEDKQLRDIWREYEQRDGKRYSISAIIRMLLSEALNGNSHKTVSEESAKTNYTDNGNASENGEQEKTGESSYTDSKKDGDNFFFDGVDF